MNTSEFNKLAGSVFNARITQASLITKTDFHVKLSSLNRKITQNKTKHLLVENKLTNLENKILYASSRVKKTDYNTKISTLDNIITENRNKLKEIIKSILLLVLGNIMFDGGDGSQAYLIFHPVYKYFKFITNTNYISSWKSNGLSIESIKPFPISDNSLTPLIEYYS